MARKKTAKSRVDIKQIISQRLREIRQERFGEHGGPELARRLDLPARTWYNYETGVTVPSEVLLSFIDQTGANALWLFSGSGPRYSRGPEDQALADLSPEELIRRGLEKLEQQPSAAADELASEVAADFVAVGMVPMNELGRRTEPDPEDGYILAYRHWLPHPGSTVAVRVDDDAMQPVLSVGSVVAVDRAVTDASALQGKLVAADPEGRPMIRWLEVSGRHLILRPNSPGAEHPMIPVDRDEEPGPIIGQVVWSWSRFGDE